LSAAEIFNFATKATALERFPSNLTTTDSRLGANNAFAVSDHPVHRVDSGLHRLPRDCRVHSHIVGFGRHRIDLAPGGRAKDRGLTTKLCIEAQVHLRLSSFFYSGQMATAVLLSTCSFISAERSSA